MMLLRPGMKLRKRQGEVRTARYDLGVSGLFPAGQFESQLSFDRLGFDIDQRFAIAVRPMNVEYKQPVGTEP